MSTAAPRLLGVASVLLFAVDTAAPASRGFCKRQGRGGGGYLKHTPRAAILSGVQDTDRSLPNALELWTASNLYSPSKSIDRTHFGEQLDKDKQGGARLALAF